MKQIRKKRIAFILSAILILAMVPAISYGDTGFFVKNSEYYTDQSGTRTGISTITLDTNDGGSIKYYEVNNGKPMALTEGNIKKILTTSYQSKGSAISNWSGVASGIFATGGGVDSEKKYNYVNIADGDYDYCFGPGATTSGAPKCDIKDCLSNTDAQFYGSETGNNVRSTGLTNASSLNKVREKAAALVSTGFNCSKLSASEMLGRGSYVDDILPKLNSDEDTMAFYNMVCSIDKKSAYHKKWNLYGICFYDFDLMPIADDDLDYVTGAEGYDSYEEASKNPETGIGYSDSTKEIKSIVKNETRETSTSGLSLGMTDSETLSNSYTETDSTSDSNTVGVHATLRLGASSDPKSGELGMSYSNTWGEAWSLANSSGSSSSNGDNYTQSVNCPVDPHTQKSVVETTKEVSYNISYNLPCAVIFKVAVFSLSGEAYADNAAALQWNTAGYEHSDSTYFFGTEDADGSFATRNLEKRYYLNKDVSGYDDSHSDTYKYYHKGTGTNNYSSSGINWSNVESSRCTGTDSILNAATYAPMISAGSTVQRSRTEMSAELDDDETMAIYPLDTVYSTSTGLSVIKGQSAKIPYGTVAGIDKYAVSFYGFSEAYGHWELQSGEDILDVNQSTSTVSGKNTGTAYIKWVFNDPDQKFKYAADENGNVKYVRAGDITALPVLPVNVYTSTIIGASDESDDTAELSDLELTSKKAELIANDGYQDIRDFVKFTGKDENGKTVDIDADYEIAEKPTRSEGTDPEEYDDSNCGRVFDKNGNVKFLGAGTYNVSTTVGDKKYTTAVEVKPERKIASVKFIRKTISIGSISRLNISSYLKVKDQYGKEWVLSDWNKHNEVEYTKLRLSLVKAGTDSKISGITLENPGRFSKKGYFTPKLKKGKYILTVACADADSSKTTLNIYNDYSHGTKIEKLTAKKGAINVKLAKNSKKYYTSKITGYQIRFSRTKDMSDSKVVTLKRVSNTSKTLKNLKSRTKYYVQTRIFKKANGKTIYSPWTNAKTIKTR